MSDPNPAHADTTPPQDADVPRPGAGSTDRAEAELIAARAKAAELDARLDKLEDEALPEPPHPASVGGMIGT